MLKNKIAGAFGFLLLLSGCATSRVESPNQIEKSEPVNRAPSSAKRVSVNIDGENYSCSNGEGEGEATQVTCRCTLDTYNNCFRVQVKSGDQTAWVNDSCNGNTLPSCIQYLKSDSSVSSTCPRTRPGSDGVSCACITDTYNNCFRVQVKSGDKTAWVNDSCNGNTLPACISYLRSDSGVQKVCN